jgi:hypothetical protein
MAATVELARGLAGRTDGLQVTSFHGSGQTAERLLEALRDGDAGADGAGRRAWLM